MYKTLLLTVFLWFPLTVSAAEKLKVVTSFTVIADMARNVAGDAASVESITKPGAEIHGYQPTPSDMVRAQGADLILYNGLNLELWFDQFLNQIGDVNRVVVTEGIEPMLIKDGPYKNKPNPHAWMSVSDATIYIDNIERAMSEADPDNALTYQKNAAAYKSNFAQLLNQAKLRISDLPPEARWLVSSEGAFSYLARDLKLNEGYLWPINSDDQGTPQQVRQLIDLIREQNIPVIFSESTISDKPAKQVVRETNARYGGVLYVDSLSAADGPVPTYLDLVKVTLETLLTGLEGK